MHLSVVLGGSFFFQREWRTLEKCERTLSVRQTGVRARILSTKYYKFVRDFSLLLPDIFTVTPKDNHQQWLLSMLPTTNL